MTTQVSHKAEVSFFLQMLDIPAVGKKKKIHYALGK